MSTEVTHDRDVWQQLVDLDRLAAWMDNQQLTGGAIQDPKPLTGGSQNVLLRFRKGGREYVLRRPPRHLRRESNAVMLREARVLKALKDSDVPHPGFIAVCDDESVIGAAFYLMEPVAGFNATEGLPAPFSDNPEMRWAMGAALVDGIVALSRVDVDKVGLGDLGKRQNWIERQTSRWRGQFESYTAFEGWTGMDALPDVDGICAWLEANRPQTMQTGLIHGDYHFANVLYNFDKPSLAAIVDWELTSLGDPLLDLGWLTTMWPEPNTEPSVSQEIHPWSGFPSLMEIVDRYLAGTGRPSSDVRWFSVLACFKLAAILEGSHARACAGKAPKAVGDRLHDRTIQLLNRAHRRARNAGGGIL